MALSSDSAFVQVNVKYRVEGLKQAARDTKKATAALGGLGKIIKQVGLSLLAFKAVNTVRQGLLDMTKALITTNTKFEKFQIQLKIFTGSGAKAADLMNFLTFQSTRLAGGLEDLLEGATALQTFGIDVKANLELIADVAQATNREVADVAIAFGRIVAGDPRTKQFLVTRRGDLEAFNNALAQGKTRLEATRIAFARFSGVSAELEGSMGRLIENFNDLLFVAAKIAGEPAFEELKEALEGIVNALRSEVFDEEGKVRVTGFFVTLGQVLKGFVTTVRDAWQGLTFLTHAINAFLNPFSVLMGGQGASFQRMGDLLAPQIRKNLGKAFLEGGDGGELGIFGFGKEADKELRKRYQQMVFGFFGLDESGFAPKEAKELMRKAIDHVNQLEKDMQREEDHLKREREKRQRMAAEAAKKSLHATTRSMILRRTGKDIGKTVNIRKGLIEAGKLFGEPAEEEPIEQFPELDPDIQEARMKAEIKMQNRFLDLKFRIQDILEKHQEEAFEHSKQRELEMMEFRFMLAERLTDRAVSDLGFVLFGGRNANARIDAQIERLQEEVDVMNGVTAPLTRQEELMNRIVELESQRISINERLGSIIRRTLSDLGQAVAKAALLRAFGFGTQARGQSGGFLGLLKAGLGLIPHPAAQAGSTAFNMIPPGGSGVGIQNAIGPGFQVQGGPPGIQQGFKPAGKMVSVTNPIFLSNDVRNVAEKFADEAGRRMR